MSPRSAQHEEDSRAAARRRTRQAARGPAAEADEDGDGDEPLVEGQPTRRGTFLQRLFPSAPPLPDKPDPLAGLTYSGPLRWIAEGLYLLRINPLVWLGAAGVWFAARVADPGGPWGFPVSLLALGAAGWFGWQRPSLYGTAAAALGYLGFIVAFAAAAPEEFAVLGPWRAMSTGLVEAALGFVTGWYGGYLRRRSVQVKAAQRPARRRR